MKPDREPLVIRSLEQGKKLRGIKSAEEAAAFLRHSNAEHARKKAKRKATLKMQKAQRKRARQ